MSKTYREYRDESQKRFNELPIMWAYNYEQFEEGKGKLGVKSNTELTRIFPGGYMKKVDVPKLKQLIKDDKKEKAELCKDESFVYDMFVTELEDHEYAYTLSAEATLDALGFEIEEIINNPMMYRALRKAMRYCVRNMNVV